MIGLAVVEREAWVLAGFQPLDKAEQAMLDAEQRKLGFWPHEQSHQLTACKDENALRSPKRVLKPLSGGNFDRERRCWQETPLETLRKNGSDNGLLAFLDEVRNRLAPLFGHVPGNTGP